jgi:hypothetical protein
LGHANTGAVDEECLGLIRSLLEKAYSGGVKAMQKHLQEYIQRNPLLGHDSLCVGFAQSLVQALGDSNPDHAVAEAIMRGDREWVERCLATVREAQEKLYLPEQEYLRLKLLELSLVYVVSALDRGLKPKLGA